jgi:dethiobiotin synthetase
VRGFFVTGTDTGVGKTVFSAALTRALERSGRRVAVMKPVASGAVRTAAGLRSEDALALMAEASVGAPYETVNPYCFLPPISPHIAAQEAGVHIELEVLQARYGVLAAAADCVIVEGAGGWLAPIAPRAGMAEIARALDLPVILVVGMRLGCLNHALLTHESICARAANFAGWVANGIDPALERATENLAALRARLGEPLAIIPALELPGALPDLAATVARLASGLESPRGAQYHDPRQSGTP